MTNSEDLRNEFAAEAVAVEDATHDDEFVVAVDEEFVAVVSEPDGSIAEVVHEADPVLLAAVDQARAALAEITPAESIGDVIGHQVEGEHVLSLFFESKLAGYPDWHWTATLARVGDSNEPSVLEVEMMPGESSVLSPAWVPWADRLTQDALIDDSESEFDDDDVDDDSDEDRDDESDDRDGDPQDRDDEDDDDDDDDEDDDGPDAEEEATLALHRDRDGIDIDAISAEQLEAHEVEFALSAPDPAFAPDARAPDAGQAPDGVDPDAGVAFDATDDFADAGDIEGLDDGTGRDY